MTTQPATSAPQSTTKQDMIMAKRLIAYFRPYTEVIFLGILASLPLAGATADTAWLIKPALDDIFIQKNADMLLVIPTIFFILILVKGMGRSFQGLAMNFTGLKVLEFLRHQVFSRVLTLPLSFFESMQIGNLMARLLGDVGTMQQRQSAFVGAERVFTMLDDPINLPESGGNGCFNGMFTSLEFRNVNLVYGNAIAQALMKNAPLFILDEATSALNSESERMVQQALENLMLGRTSLIIAHRLSTILEADKIVVMDEGRIVAQGTHKELIENCALYQRLYSIQFKTEDNPSSNIHSEGV